MGGSRGGASLRGAEVKSWESEWSCEDVKARSSVLCAAMVETRLLRQTHVTVLFSDLGGNFPGNMTEKKLCVRLACSVVLV